MISIRKEKSFHNIKLAAISFNYEKWNFQSNFNDHKIENEDSSSFIYTHLNVEN